MRNLYTYILIGVLFCIIIMQRSCNKSIPASSIQTVRIDTIFKIKHDTIIKPVKLIKEKLVYPKNIVQPSNNIDTCKAKFTTLSNDFYTKRTYKDTINLKELGNIIVVDTVWMNKLHGKRKYIENYKIPTIIKTITKPLPAKNQLYIGGELMLSTNSLGTFVPSIIYKNKKDQIYKFSVGVGIDGQISYGVGTFWKIKL